MPSHQLTHLYAALGELNEAIVRSSDRQSLFEQACAIAVRQGRFRSALLWWIHPETPAVAERAAFATSSNQQVNPRGSIDLNAPKSYSPTICALVDGKIDICNDIGTDSRIHWRPGSTAWRGIDSCAAFPLRENGRLAGALSLYATQDGAFDPDTVNLLTRIAADLSYALDGFLRETKRRETEEALRRSERQMHIITDGVPAMIAYLDTDLRYRFMNQAYATFYGRPRELMLGKTVAETIDERDLARLRAERKERGVTGGYSAGGIRNRLRTLHDHTGAVRYFKGLTIPDLDEEGKERGRFILNTEITELVQAEQALQESEERFQLAVRGSSDGIWDFNLSTGVRYYSPRFKRILGYADEELQGNYATITSLMTPEDRERVDEALRHHLFARVPFDIECRMHHREGHWIWVRFRGQAQWDDNGRATRVAGSATDISDRKLIEEKLLQLAHYDSLTGLPNRVTFQDRIEQSLLQAKRNNWLIGVLFVDLDRFKAVNDTLGHAAGDELLRQVSARMSLALRAGDTVGRLGGDEFAVLLPDLGSIETARIVARKLIQTLQEPFTLHEKLTSIGASIGIAVSPQDGEYAEQLLKNADTAMYHAKECGRGNFQFYSQSLNTDTDQQNEVEQRLRQAIERKELVLHFLPKAGLESGVVTGLEVQPRWMRPGAAVMLQEELMTLADKTGQTMPIWEWMITAACSQAAGWQQKNMPPLSIALNISKRQFRERGVVALVMRALAASGLKAECLELEIAESLFLDRQCSQTLTELRKLGVRICITDFGTGYSSLSYLTQFPVDVLKIHHTFVESLSRDPNDLALASAIIAMAHKLGCIAVADGVATTVQRDLLHTLGCNEYLGPLLGQACSADQLQTLLAGR